MHHAQRETPTVAKCGLRRQSQRLAVRVTGINLSYKMFVQVYPTIFQNICNFYLYV